MAEALPVLLVSAGIIHPPLSGRLALRRALERSGFALRQVSSLGVLPALQPAQYRALVLYFHRKKISEEALQVLADYLQAGGGCLALHSASASFKEQPRFTELLGGRFRSHGPVERLQVRPALTPDPLFGPISSFEIQDERYLHDCDPGNTVHFYTEVAGQREPLVWSRRSGRGRVLYCAAGHTAASLRHPAVVEILISGLRWAAGAAGPGEAL